MSLVDRRKIAAWITFDIALHGYQMMIPSVGFAVYFTTYVAAKHPFADGLWGIAVAAPLVIAGLLSPWLGALTDALGFRRLLLAGTTLVCGLASALMMNVSEGDIAAGMLLFIVAQVAFLLASAMYNAYLPEISTQETSGRISGLAWGLSYLGGIACLLLCLPFIRGGIDSGNSSYFANSFVVTAAFLLVVGLGSLRSFPKEIPSKHKQLGNPYQRILETVRFWRQDREIPKFLLAYYLINDAVVTLIYFTAVFLKTTFGLGLQEILLLSLAFQLIAIPSTLFFGWLGDRWSQFGAVILTLAIWILVLGLMAVAEGEHAPLLIVSTLGLVLGATQSLLRSMYSRMIPAERAGEYFGFHALVGRASSALGPLMFGAVSVLAGSQRIAMASLGLFLLAGAIILTRVKSAIGNQ